MLARRYTTEAADEGNPSVLACLALLLFMAPRSSKRALHEMDNAGGELAAVDTRRRGLWRIVFNKHVSIFQPSLGRSNAICLLKEI